MSHKPNPFDFVPFGDEPRLYPESDFAGMGSLLSGYLELHLKTLTPVHVVGAQDDATGTRSSHMARQNRRAVIPAASIRGCLRSYIEALTGGWVSQASESYDNQFPKKRQQIRFRTFEENYNRKRDYYAPPALSPVFRPKLVKLLADTTEAAGNSALQKSPPLMDVASYLFGIVTEAAKNDVANQQELDGAADVLTRKGRLWFEDAFLSDSCMVKDKYWMPDIDNTAFMGGPKPSASNWWYLTPAEIWNASAGKAKFVGAHFRGRKFYFHQDPVQCVALYCPKHDWQRAGCAQPGQWTYDHKRPFCKIKLECAETETLTETFRIYFDRLPEKLARLFVMSLLPGSHIRHKLGYGKAYGYGSVEFILTNACLRREATENSIPEALSDWTPVVQEWAQHTWAPDELQAQGIEKLIDRNALNSLARILSWEPSCDLLFMYPPYKGGFMTLLDYVQVKQTVPEELQAEERIRLVNESGEELVEGAAKAIATALFSARSPTLFDLYQESADGWDTIAARAP